MKCLCWTLSHLLQLQDTRISNHRAMQVNHVSLVNECGELEIRGLRSWEKMNAWERWVRFSEHCSLSSWLVTEAMERWQRGRLLQSVPTLLSYSLPDFSGQFFPPSTIQPLAPTSFVDLCSMYPENLSNMVFAAFPMSTLVLISSMNSSWLMRHAFPFQKPRCHYLTPCLPSFAAPQGLHK